MSVLYAPRPTGELAKQAAAHSARLRRLHVVQKPISAVVTEFVELHPDLSVKQPALPNALMQNALAELDVQSDDPPPACRIMIGDIQRVVASFYSVSVSDLCSARRTANVVRPRQVAMYLAKTLTLRSLPEVGRRFGGRDHTTVLHATRKIGALVCADPSWKAEIAELTAILHAGSGKKPSSREAH